MHLGMFAGTLEVRNFPSLQSGCIALCFMGTAADGDCRAFVLLYRCVFGFHSEPCIGHCQKRVLRSH